MNDLTLKQLILLAESLMRCGHILFFNLLNQSFCRPTIVLFQGQLHFSSQKYLTSQKNNLTFNVNYFYTSLKPQSGLIHFYQYASLNFFAQQLES